MTKPSNTVLSILNDSGFPRLKSHIVARTGLHYYQNKSEDLASRIARRFSATGAKDCSSYLSALERSNGAQNELDLLVIELTIGETYFFRHPEQFDAFRKIILPKVLEKNQSRKSLRIWCAGCSTGAEPYTISIILKREFKLQTAGWSIQILGTDINRNFLNRATEGNFDDWHLRSTNDDMKRSCFEKINGSWSIRPEFKQGLSFQAHNLVSDSFPPSGSGFFDIIFCRNVMIYFDRKTMSEILERFERCMNEGAWLLLGYAEISSDQYKPFVAVPVSSGIIFQKKKAEAVPPAAPLDFKILNFEIPSSAPSVAPSPPSSEPSTATESLEVTYHKCQELAAAGEYAAAIQMIDRMIQHDPFATKAHYLRGLAFSQLGKYPDAEQALRKAVYLDRNFILAHYHLALVYQQLGQVEKLKRHLNNALALAQSLNDSTPLPSGDGMIVSQIKEAIAIIMERS